MSRVLALLALSQFALLVAGLPRVPLPVAVPAVQTVSSGFGQKSLSGSLVGLPSMEAKDESEAIAALERMVEFVDEALAPSSPKNPTMLDKVTQLFTGDSIIAKQHIFGITIEANFGTPAQTQTLLLNFLSCHIWVIGKKYILSHLIKNRFNESASTSLTTTDENFKYTDCSDYKASGHYVLDKVEVNDVSAQIRFGVADSAALYLPALGINGVLGLTASPDGSGESSLADLLLNADEEVVTIYHNPKKSFLSKSENNVLVTFGGSDDHLCKKDWSSVDATNDGVWKVDTYGLSIDSNPRRNKNAEKAVIVSTLPVTLVPHRTIIHLRNILNAKTISKKAGIYSVSCENLPTLYFNIGSHRVPLHPEHYTYKVYGKCFLRIFEISQKVSKKFGGVEFVFAEPLLRSNCVRFDTDSKEISFATPIPIDEDE